eukprot:CAMPEP_0182551130 /NCGR_PEP_ID=MMETSP1323-20130603/43779_1 /TAXON_ID=236787 /ORGANISM="Florenciella parvula, Strain RCC1693" /LENGTH=96 /DNA_ID=CAMNT_0024762711 /DNA_START=8 /DNA_END=295 /DNA_ORIENTATION=+
MGAAAAAVVAAEVSEGPSTLPVELTAMLEEYGHDSYQVVLNLINSVVDGSTDQAKFEESCRLLLGTRAYMVLTIDRVITQTVKQLALLALDPTFQK